MTYQSLYREYRPSRFEDVVGQDHIVKTLVNQIKSGSIGHAYLFTGSRGIGKTTCARIFAKAINCLHPTESGSPCGECEVCKNLADQSNMDILEIDAASNNKVEEIREIREKVKYPPVHGKYKVYIIDEVHMLTESAFNALLKTLEEPPQHAVFILATTEVHKLPATILSRCMRFDFRLVSQETLVAHLKNIFDKNNISYDDASVEAIAAAGEGSVRDSLSISDCAIAFGNGKIDYKTVTDILGVSDRTQVFELADHIIDKDLGGVLETIAEAYKQGKNLVVLMKDLTVHFKNLVTIKSCREANKILNEPKEIYDKMLLQANRVTTSNLLTYMEKLSAVEADLKYALSPRTLVEVVTLECASVGDNPKN